MMTRHQRYENYLYDNKLHTELRNKVKRCMYCGKTEESKEVRRLGARDIVVTTKLTNLNIHHIDGNKVNNKLSNLTILCQKCHATKGHILVMKNGKIATVLVNRKIKFKTLEEEFGSG